MDDVARLLTLLALVGAALTLLGGVFAWRLDEVRRIRRSLTLVLEVDPQPLLTARGRGAGIGFNLGTRKVAVTSDRGVWCLVFEIDELMGVELIVDRQVVARSFRNESRRPLDQLTAPEERVRLRFVFDDPAHADFDIDLWRPEDDNLHGRPDAETALQEANRWMARMEAILRRGARTATPVWISTDLAASRPVQTIQLATPMLDDDDDDDDDHDDAGVPPWDEVPVDDDEPLSLHRKS